MEYWRKFAPKFTAMDIKSLHISQLSEIKNIATKYSNLDDDYVLSRINIEPQQINKHTSTEKAIRINGLTLILCLKGNFSVDINIDHYDITANTILVAGPNSIIKFNSIEPDTLEAYTLFVSLDFLKDVNLDINALNPQNFTNRQKHITTLSDDETILLRKYLDLIHLNTTNNTNHIYSKNIARCLMASLLYQMMQFGSSHKIEDDETAQPQSRRMNYVRDFMTLVQQYHSKERSVGFYADRLFISPKYLSLIIKETTGRSAADWIDEFVILEAKNMLRFSGKNIQQVAYDLNFTNQSSFGKYFKHLTGMSPSEFQRT